MVETQFTYLVYLAVKHSPHVWDFAGVLFVASIDIATSFRFSLFRVVNKNFKKARGSYTPTDKILAINIFTNSLRPKRGDFGILDRMKGWIALDIDGTITLDKYSVPQPVTDFLRGLSEEGWKVAMATGRPFAFASMALSKFDFPFIFLPQNGSVALEMPGQQLLFKRYLSSSVVPWLEEAYEGIDTDFVIYAGYEKGDFCYWRPKRLSPEDHRYLEDLQKRQRESWRAVDRYEGLSDFPLIKCFGTEMQMEKVAHRLKRSGKFQVAKIRDPFVEGKFLLLVTDILASKGESLKGVFSRFGRGDHVIAAGDDENDLSLLEVADTKIAMHHAPEILQKNAHFIAPPTKDQGIIQALKMALRNAH